VSDGYHERREPSAMGELPELERVTLPTMFGPIEVLRAGVTVDPRGAGSCAAPSDDTADLTETLLEQLRGDVDRLTTALATAEAERDIARAALGAASLALTAAADGFEALASRAPGGER
jgi:hypothetical protein